MLKDTSKNDDKRNNLLFSDSDVLVRAKVSRPDIQLIVKFVEGLGHMGVVTTSDKISGEVIIQTTRYCWPDLKVLLEKMPFDIDIREINPVIGRFNEFFIDE